MLLSQERRSRATPGPDLQSALKIMPTSMLMQELVLNHPEFLALLDAVHARRIVGIDPASLFPSNEEERRAVLAAGKEALHQRGAFQSQGQSEDHLSPAFESIARTIAFPEIAIILVRNVTGVGPQLFLHYMARGQAVEHTFPQEQVHRLALLPDIPTMIEREHYILALQETPTPNVTLEMSEDDFRIAGELARHQPPERAEAFLAQHGVHKAEAAKLLQTLASPTFVGSVAVLRCEHKEVVDARSIFVLQGADSAWRATQKVPGVPLLLIQSTNASDIKNQVRRYLDELSRPVQSGV